MCWNLAIMGLSGVMLAVGLLLIGWSTIVEDAGKDVKQRRMRFCFGGILVGLTWTIAGFMLSSGLSPWECFS